jgi:hypothetical protein
VDQDSKNPAEQLNGSLGRIIGSCDMMVTPIFDPYWRNWSSDSSEASPCASADVQRAAFKEYLAPSFIEYLERGWCRLEMFFNANMPLTAQRHRYFGGRLKEVMLEKRRPHLVFGTREQELGEMPILLRALRDDEFVRYHPAKGKLSNNKDTVIISAYVEELFKINKNLKVCACVNDCHQADDRISNCCIRMWDLCGGTICLRFKRRKELCDNMNEH